MYESSLASCAIENNEFAKMHLDNCRNMELVEKHEYLKKVFDEIKDKYKT